MDGRRGMGKFRKTVRKTLNTALGVTGFQLRRVGERVHVIPFQPFSRTLRAAKEAGLSVGDYIDQKFHLPGATQGTIDQLVKLDVIRPGIQTVCEIGPGSGRYLEKVRKICRPSSYEIYETDQEWADWLMQSYDVLARSADGTTLRETPDESVDLIHAHKVFVYLPFVVTCGYLKEMVRVTRSGGRMVFDVVSEGCMPDATLEKWITSGIYYPCIMPRDFVISFFQMRKCSLQSSFFAPMLPGQSEYLVFVKDFTSNQTNDV
jgi:hypothetical protein